MLPPVQIAGVPRSSGWSPVGGTRFRSGSVGVGTGVRPRGSSVRGARIRCVHRRIGRRCVARPATGGGIEGRSIQDPVFDEANITLRERTVRWHARRTLRAEHMNQARLGRIEWDDQGAELALTYGGA